MYIQSYYNLSKLQIICYGCINDFIHILIYVILSVHSPVKTNSKYKIIHNPCLLQG